MNVMEMRFFKVAFFVMLLIVFLILLGFAHNKGLFGVKRAGGSGHDYKVHTDRSANLLPMAYPVFHTLTFIQSKAYNITPQLSASLTSFLFVLIYAIAVFYFCKILGIVESSWFINTFILSYAPIIAMPGKGTLFFGLGATDWHSPTMTAARPFSFILFFLFCNYLGKTNIIATNANRLLSLSTLFFLSALAKPVYIIVFYPASIVFSLLKKKYSYILLFTTLFAVIGVIQKIVLVDTVNFEIVIAPFRVLDHMFGGQILLGLAIGHFLVLTLLLYINKSLSLYSKFALLCHLGGIAVISLFSEGDEKWLHYNFSWTFYMTIEFLLICLLVDFYKKAKSSGGIGYKEYFLQFVILLCMYSGFVHNVKVLLGARYS